MESFLELNVKTPIFAFEIFPAFTFSFDIW